MYTSSITQTPYVSYVLRNIRRKRTIDLPEEIRYIICEYLGSCPIVPSRYIYEEVQRPYNNMMSSLSQQDIVDNEIAKYILQPFNWSRMYRSIANRRRYSREIDDITDRLCSNEVTRVSYNIHNGLKFTSTDGYVPQDTQFSWRCEEIDGKFNHILVDINDRAIIESLELRHPVRSVRSYMQGKFNPRFIHRQRVINDTELSIPNIGPCKYMKFLNQPCDSPEVFISLLKDNLDGVGIIRDEEFRMKVILSILHGSDVNGIATNRLSAIVFKNSLKYKITFNVSYSGSRAIHIRVKADRSGSSMNDILERLMEGVDDNEYTIGPHRITLDVPEKVDMMNRHSQGNDNLIEKYWSNTSFNFMSSMVIIQELVGNPRPSSYRL